MIGNNQSMPIEFDMIGLSSHPELQPLFFTIFFVVYIAALVGNVAITTIIASDSRLHTPMYFFLINLSILDICCTTAAIPKVLQIIQSKKKTVSFPECITQLCIFSTALSAELILLTVMACDRYVAICIPLHYSTIMNRNTCILLAVAVWFLGFLNAIVHTGLILRLKFCKHNIIDHYFCEVPSVLKAACSDTYINNMAVIIADVFLGMACFILTSLSYTHIISTILKIRSAEKKKKAFSTCASHITVVTLLYGGVIYTYIRPGFNYILEADKVMSAFYTIVSPLLNPIIYSLRNKEVINAFKKLLNRIFYPQKYYRKHVFSTYCSLVKGPLNEYVPLPNPEGEVVQKEDGNSEGEFVKISAIMEGNNQSSPIMFYMIGFSNHPDLQPLFVALFLIIYIAALLGNSLITTIIANDSRLHTPMYFFLINLSILDICCTTVTIPMVLQILLSTEKTIPFSECIIQLCIFSSVLGSELMLLTVMGLDRYVAICIPLRYSTIMSKRTCILLAAVVWILGFINSFFQTELILKLTFCQHNILDHFFCEVPSLLNLACSDTFINTVIVIIADIFFGMGCFLLIVISYTYIISAILRIRSADKKKKAFSTCASHLTVVTLYYGGVIYTYVKSTFSNNPEADKVISAVYTFVSPVLNPIIYSLRNKEVLNAVKKLLGSNMIPKR
uniref:Olfactory receptor 1I1-like n=1 Tax=Geotrypetes seraphini TaxID=260995 RepID=A0A6P8P460_GEOSA|nr:olfactory receptor 1I1-like [Geotrypetes seraphini]